MRRDEPVRLERYLSLDYVDRAAKLRELGERTPRSVLADLDIVVAWVMAGAFALWLCMAW